MYNYDPRKTAFYNSPAWRKLARVIRLKNHYLCQRCGNKGAEVHHKIELDAGRLNDEQYMRDLGMNEDNLQLLCVNCHNAQRSKICGEDVYFDENGELKLRR